jgi:hypothetical protein
VHSKLLVVDDDYAQIGSANVDPRSLRLNFELNVEIFDADVAASAAAHCDRPAQRPRDALADVDGRRCTRAWPTGVLAVLALPVSGPCGRGEAVTGSRDHVGHQHQATHSAVVPICHDRPARRRAST